MRPLLAAGLLWGGVSFLSFLAAQNTDPNLTREVAAVRADLARSHDELLNYVWTEQTEVLVGGKVKSSSAARCGYDSADHSKVVREPMGEAPEKPGSRQTSNRPVVRSKGEMQDYIERAVSRIREYVPPKPEVIDYVIHSGKAMLVPPTGATAEVRMTHYFQKTDSVVFTYDYASKRLLRVAVWSDLGPKDPITLEAAFDLLPGNVNHLSTATLKARSKSVQVNVKNVEYRKIAN